MLNIYLASSWRNTSFDHVFEKLYRFLVQAGINAHIYNFKENGFSFQEVAQADPRMFPVEDWKQLLDFPDCNLAFEKDSQALHEADLLIMLLPCGASAHLELGYALGKGIPAIIYVETPFVELDLMHKECELICTSFDELRMCIMAINEGKDGALNAFKAGESVEAIEVRYFSREQGEQIAGIDPPNAFHNDIPD